MTKVIAIANQKGGVGKTSTTVNLGAGLVRQGFDVLLVDMDSQANLTMALGFQNPDEMQFTIANVLQKAVREETIRPEEGILTSAEGIDLMPSNVQLSGVELSLINEYGREAVLKQYIDAVRLNYDYILIDCAPSLSVLTINALVAADSVLIPTQPQYFSMAGIQMFYDTFCKVKRKMNPSLQIEGVLVTMMDNRPNFTKDLVAQLRESYGDTFKVFDTEIPTSIRMSESSARGRSIFAYDRKNKVAAAYEKLTREVIENGREGQTVQRELRTVQTTR